MRLAAVSVFSAVGILSGCADSTGLGPAKVEVTIMSQNGPDVVQPSPSEITVTCSVGLNAMNEGGVPATWLDSWVLVFAGPDRSRAVDTLQIDAATMEQAWGSRTVEPANRAISGWTFTASVPFAITFVFRYRGRTDFAKESRPSFHCGPEVPLGTLPPTFTALSAEPSAGEIQSGDSVRVTYTAESTVGLWETSVRFSGACELAQTFPEVFALTVTRSLKLFVPSGCTPGQMLEITVEATDVALRGIGMRLSLPYVDRTPPTVGGLINYGLSNRLQPFVFAGDTLTGGVGAADNNRLAGAFWEVWPAGKRDSVKMAEQSLSQPFAIPIPDTWIGKIQMRLYSRDAAGLVSDTLVSPPESIRVYPTVTRPLRYTLPILDIRAVAPDLRRNRAWVLMQEHNVPVHRLFGVSLTSMALVDTIAVHGGWDLDLTPGGDSLIATAGYGLDVIDLTTVPPTVSHLTLASVDSSRGQYAQNVRVAANGKVFVILVGQTLNDNQLVEVDLAAGTDHVRTDAGNGGLIGGVWLEPSLDRSVLFLKGSEGIQKYVSATDAFSAPQALHSQSVGGLAVDATGAHVSVGWDFYDGAMQFLRLLDTPSPYPSIPMLLSPDGSTYYHALWPHGILSGDTQTGYLIDRQRTPQSLYMKMASDGSKIIFVDAQFGRLGVMDLQ
jgi:hypothetical protein